MPARASARSRVRWPCITPPFRSSQRSAMIREAPPRSRNLIDGASFGLKLRRQSGRAVDAAWAEISNNFGDEPADVEKARLGLAKVILSIANEDSRDVAVLKRAPLQRMAFDYKRRG